MEYDGLVGRRLILRPLDRVRSTALGLIETRGGGRPRSGETRTVPKLKSHRGAAKRFRLTGRGKVRRRHALKNHILTKKTTKRKRHLRKDAAVSPAFAKSVRRMIAT